MDGFQPLAQMLKFRVNENALWPLLETSVQIIKKFLKINPETGHLDRGPLFLHEFKLTTDSDDEDFDSFDINASLNESLNSDINSGLNTHILDILSCLEDKKLPKFPLNQDIIKTSRMAQYILRQTKSYDYMVFVFSVRNKAPNTQRDNPVIEYALIQNYLQIIQFTSKPEFKPTKMFYQRIRDIATQTVLLLVYQNCTFNNICTFLLYELETKKIKHTKTAGQYVAWMLLQYISGCISKMKDVNEYNSALKLIEYLCGQDVTTESKLFSETDLVYYFSPLVAYHLIYRKSNPDHVSLSHTILETQQNKSSNFELYKSFDPHSRIAKELPSPNSVPNYIKKLILEMATLTKDEKSIYTQLPEKCYILAPMANLQRVQQFRSGYLNLVIFGDFH